jgi:sigma-B regulation protein RsbU (phosphoserine phosphatase)
MVLSTALTDLGHEVLSAEDGEDAWYRYISETPRIVITDWMMPKLNGLELCRKIRADRRLLYTYCIMLTALGGRESFLEGMNAGADDFLTKPVDIHILHARVRVAERVIRLQSEASDLEGLLPICTYCKQIRDDRDTWQPIEQYVAARTETSFAQNLCPECSGKAEGNGSPDDPPAKGRPR